MANQATKILMKESNNRRLHKQARSNIKLDMFPSCEKELCELFHLRNRAARTFLSELGRYFKKRKIMP